MIDMRTSDKGERGSSSSSALSGHALPYPPSSFSSPSLPGDSPSQRNPIHHSEPLTADKIHFVQKTAPLVPVPYTSISKFCRPSKETYQTCANKVPKYQPRDFRGWRALLTTANTILTNWTTWYKLCALTVVCFITTGVVVVTDSQGSIGDIDVTSRVQLLLSFVLAGYVSYYVNYFNSVRHQYLGTLWGACENMFLYAHQLFPGSGEQEVMLRRTVQRYTHSIFLLVFHACQNKTDLEFFYGRNLLTPEEGAILIQATLGTRPLIIVGWLSKLFETTQRIGYGSFIIDTQVTTVISGLRGGVGGLLGVIGTPPPFMYTHLMYWIVQIFLLILAITTGINLAIFWDRRQNGDENYSYDDGEHWPQKPKIYYVNYFFQQTAGNMIFAIFVEGLLYFCGEIENPLAGRNASLSEELYEVFLENNCIALAVGRESMEAVLTIREESVSPTVKKNSKGGLPVELIQQFLGKAAAGSGIGGGIGHGNGTALGLGHGKMSMNVKMNEAKLIGDMNCKELCEVICSLGDAYVSYGNQMKERGITGQVFLNLSEEDMKIDFGVVDKYHLRGLEYLKVRENSNNTNNNNDNDNNSSNSEEKKKN